MPLTRVTNDSSRSLCDPMYLACTFVFPPPPPPQFFALILSAVWWNVKHDQSGIQSIIGLLLMSATTTAFRKCSSAGRPWLRRDLPLTSSMVVSCLTGPLCSAVNTQATVDIFVNEKVCPCAPLHVVLRRAQRLSFV